MQPSSSRSIAGTWTISQPKRPCLWSGLGLKRSFRSLDGVGASNHPLMVFKVCRNNINCVPHWEISLHFLWQWHSMRAPHFLCRWHPWHFWSVNLLYPLYISRKPVNQRGMEVNTLAIVKVCRQSWRYNGQSLCRQQIDNQYAGNHDNARATKG